MSTTPTAPQGTGGANSMMAGITTAHLIVLAVFAVMVVIAILYGARLRARRRAAERDERERIAEFDAAPPPPSPEPTPSTAGAGEPPIAPSPPLPSPAGGDVPVPAADIFGTSPAALSPEPARPDEARETPTPAPAPDPHPAPRGPSLVSVSPTGPESPPASAMALTQLKGLGPKVAARLAELGITRLDQMAALDEDAAEAIDAELGPFRGRLTRDRWVEQARFLAADDRAGFEAVFGKL